MQSPIPAQITKVQTLARSVRIIVDTQETVTSEQMAELFKLYEKVGWFFFLDTPTAEIDPLTLPDIKVEDGEKTPSKRLRDRMFVYYRSSHGKSEGFDTWYINEMDRVGQKYLDKVA